MSNIDPYNKDTIEVIKQALSDYGIELEEGKGLKKPKINNGGFPMANISHYTLVMEMTALTGNGTQE